MAPFSKTLHTLSDTTKTPKQKMAAPDGAAFSIYIQFFGRGIPYPIIIQLFQVKALEVHDFVPCGHEVPHETCLS